MAFVVALWALPSGAQLLELHRSLAPPVELPERPAFEELLFSFADPERALKGGFTVPSLSLAVRSRAWAFVRPGMHEQREALDALSISAQDLTLSDVPAGRQLATFLNLDPELERLRVRDFGPWFRGSSGPLQRVLRSALDRFPGPRPAAMATAGVAALGLIYQFGTGRMDELGLSPMLRGTAYGGLLHASIRLHSEPRFQNARAEMLARVRLPETLRLPLLDGRFEHLEVGGTAARTADGVVLDTRWANLRGRLAWLELSLGVRSSHAEPQLWMDIETSMQRERFSLRAVFSRQWATARLRSMAMATLRTGPVMSGLFVGIHETVGGTFGLVSMGTF